MVQNLRKILGAREQQESTDEQFVRTFLRRRDAESFEAIIRRHGPMVLGVCRRMLADADLTDEAFQAVFAVLARRIDGIRPQTVLANWLFLTAHRAATLGRRGPETARSMPLHESTPENLWRELQPLLDDEIARLPDRDRAALILCDLEGKTRKEAACLLGWQDDTLANHLARARSSLVCRMKRRGLLFSTGDLAVAMSQNIAWGIPATCVRQTAQAALDFGCSSALAKTLLARKRSPLVFVALTVVLLATGGFLATLVRPTPAPVNQAARPPCQAQSPMCHPGAVTRLALAEGRPWLASAGAGVVCLWERQCGEQLRCLTGFQGEITSLSFSADDTTLVVLDAAGVHLCNLNQDHERRSLPLVPREAEAVAVSPDGARVAHGGRSGVIHVKDLRTGRHVLSFQGPSYIVLGLAFGPHGKNLAAAGGDNTSRLFDAATGKQLVSAHDHKAIQTCVAFNADGDLFASAGPDGAVTVRQVRSGTVLHRLEHGNDVVGVQFTPDGRLVATTTTGSVHRWDVSTGQLVTRDAYGSPSGRTTLALSRDGRRIASAVGGEIQVRKTGR